MKQHVRSQDGKLGYHVLEVHCVESVVCGNNVYRQIWTHVVGEKLPQDHCVISLSNACFADFKCTCYCLVHVKKNCLVHFVQYTARESYFVSCRQLVGRLDVTMKANDYLQKDKSCDDSIHQSTIMLGMYLYHVILYNFDVNLSQCCSS